MRYPEEIIVQVSHLYDTFIAKCIELPGFFLYNKELSKLVSSIKSSLSAYYLAKYDVDVKFYQRLVQGPLLEQGTYIGILIPYGILKN